jgi:hypothetical protein
MSPLIAPLNGLPGFDVQSKKASTFFKLPVNYLTLIPVAKPYVVVLRRSAFHG